MCSEGVSACTWDRPCMALLAFGASCIPRGELSVGRSWCFDRAHSASHSLGARGFTEGHLNNLELEIPRKRTAFFCLIPSDCNSNLKFKV